MIGCDNDKNFHFRSGVPRKVAFVGWQNNLILVPFVFRKYLRKYCAEIWIEQKLCRHGEADNQLEKFLPGLVGRVEAVCNTLRSQYFYRFRGQNGQNAKFVPKKWGGGGRNVKLGASGVPWFAFVFVPFGGGHNSFTLCLLHCASCPCPWWAVDTDQGLPLH